ncbi:MAG: N-6 DNA methylase [Haemophilus parainfluenzae]
MKTRLKKKKSEKMPIFLLFIQHILFSLKENGKAAIVLPTGFITAQSGIDKKFANIWWKTNARRRGVYAFQYFRHDGNLTFLSCLSTKPIKTR